MGHTICVLLWSQLCCVQKYHVYTEARTHERIPTTHEPYSFQRLNFGLLCKDLCSLGGHHSIPKRAFLFANQSWAVEDQFPR